MRWFHLAVVVLFAAATVVFAAQNFETVTISFFRMTISRCRRLWCICSALRQAAVCLPCFGGHMQARREAPASRLPAGDIIMLPLEGAVATRRKTR
jgi:uncharacterized integral membrane protein